MTMAKSPRLAPQSPIEPAHRRRSVDISRCFVALWPDLAARDALDALASRLRGNHPASRHTPREQLHLTLAFIGALENQKASDVADTLRKIEAEPFDWRLDQCAGFERAHILWAGGPDEPRLIGLAHRVRESLDELHVAYDRKPFSAHVTLLRNVARAAFLRLDTPINWRVEKPRLVISDRDATGKTHYVSWGDRSLE